MQEMPEHHPDIVAADELSDVDCLRQRHWVMLIVCAAVVVLSFSLMVFPDREHIALQMAPEYPLPDTCLARSIFDVKCPGCGLTRSFIMLADGDWRRSLGFHPLGWVLALAVLIQFPYRILSLVRRQQMFRTAIVPRAFGITLIILLVGNWVWQSVGG